jgi:HEPN domain-containing protein
MVDVNELKAWIAYAEEDLGSAKLLFKAKKPFFSAVCFHAQQCSEKYLKALLIFKDFDFPKTHDLVTLDSMCNQNGIFTGFDTQQLADLTKHAVQTRYPGNQPTPEEAQEAIEIATTVRKFSRTYLGLKK